MSEFKDNKDFFLKEIELIQNIISRMASNSFLVKGWAVTLVVATLLLDGKSVRVYISFIPLLLFWFLDAYFLWQERLYRKLYDWVISNRMKTDENLFNLNAYRFKGEVQSKWRIMFSTTLGCFYGLIGILIVIYSVILSRSYPGGR